MAPAAPIEPVVETSISERFWSSPASTFASWSITAVPESPASPGSSRSETITIVPACGPARVPITVSRVRGPSAVCARKLCVVTAY